MKHFFNCILIAVGLFMYEQNIYAQTLNADTLAKYKVSKILTYRLDDAGEKVLAETIHINQDGKISESYSYYRFYEDSIDSLIHVDTTKYTYDSNKRILKITYITHNPTIDSKYSNDLNYTIEYNYKNLFIINPLSKKRIRHVHTSGNKKIIKSYKFGSYTDYCKHFFRNNIEYSIEKHYFILVLSSSDTVIETSAKKLLKRRKKRSEYRKCEYVRMYTRNSFGHTIEENVTSTYYFKNRFKKFSKKSYAYSYQYTYKDSFLSSCKELNSSMNTEDMKFYEYITNPE